MHTVINIILVCNFPGQLDLHCLQPFRLTAGSGDLSVGFPVLPAVSLHMSTIGDTTCQIGIRQRYFDCFQPLCASDSTGNLSVSAGCLPSIALYMGRIGQHFIFCFVRDSPVARCVLTFFHQFDLNDIQFFCIPQSSGSFSVFCPIQPSDTLYIRSVIYIILFC